MVLSLHQGESSFDVLSEGECLWMLERTYVGRVGVTIGALPAIFPVNYAVHEGQIYFRTDKGTKLSAALRGSAVAFQIDSFDTRYHHGWAVQAIGMAEVVDDDEASGLLDTLPIEPWAPGPHEHLVRIRPEFVSGRRIGFSHEPARAGSRPSTPDRPGGRQLARPGDRPWPSTHKVLPGG